MNIKQSIWKKKLDLSRRQHHLAREDLGRDLFLYHGQNAIANLQYSKFAIFTSRYSPQVSRNVIQDLR